ncbi:NAD(P)H-dependent oxidoreductase [Pseudomonas fluorescens]|uniref:NAD(P)H-dependent oxidoreductase n=1 Tax=Pseudomonas fluorescens TaxID=294 RepID=A0AAE2Q114_PSEFL|nr:MULTISPECIES: NAD(P)H-dependent oxidoreductase [Pseudomonas fluorescens group]MBA1431904.1 NAD(P)H-dependent oxidoreductase [Pseudomonas orientalis]MBD8151358.1 NAD(P)H-dependent oxidoreductase [Pseudomonas fluorescens]MBD8175932.1 NAD(P)H-dependent oxidoreductase [Pseudomonas fluorescens]MBD8271769.1 NAD(P)H-dependent oxidoreductase [Pseudomonas fluorescens]MBD8744817.1 NAD(P)H-dependent oxidoreductase [Pseudomonas fluorescens]
MHALIVVAHHDPQSLTRSVAEHVAAGLSASDHTFEIADLAAEGFDPRYTAADHLVHRSRATPPADVLAEQARIERADALVVVFPIYWWSMPALLKGWIDRVFVNGWAIDYGPDLPVTKKLRHLKVHLLALGAADESAFDRHGYAKAMRTQIDYGIFDYCGAQVLTSQLLLESESDSAQAHLHRARTVGQGLFERETVAG